MNVAEKKGILYRKKVRFEPTSQQEQSGRILYWNTRFFHVLHFSKDSSVTEIEALPGNGAHSPLLSFYLLFIKDYKSSGVNKH